MKLSKPAFLSENYFSKLEKNRQDIKHKEKLLKIIAPSKHEAKTTNTYAQQSMNFDSSQYAIIKKKDLQRRQNKELGKINFENQRMLNNLVQISQGKRSQSLSKYNCRPQLQGVQTYNRQKLNKIHEIDYENRQLAQRILNQKPVISRDKMRNEVKNYLKLRNHMSKFKLPQINQRGRAVSNQPRSSNLHNYNSENSNYILEQNGGEQENHHNNQDLNKSHQQESQQEEQQQQEQQTIKSEQQQQENTTQGELDNTQNQTN